MSFFTPSASDVLGICKFAWSTYTSFRDAPSEFQLITSDCKSLHTVLRAVDEEVHDRWAPMNRNTDSSKAMQQCLEDARKTLELLGSQLSKYYSLGTDKKSVAQRARYVTENFDDLRARMQRDRMAIDSQINVGTNEVVGRIYKAIRLLAADMRAGRKESTIVSGHRGAGKDDTWALLKRQIDVDNVSVADLDKLRPQIEPYALELLEDGAFEEEAPLYQNMPDITPYDSVTTVDSERSAPSFVGSAKKISLESDSLETFRSAPIEGLSFRTISNPAYNTKGHRRPETFDMWKLAQRCWSMQSICTRELSKAGRLDETGRLISSIATCLAMFNPALILAISESSVESQRFWNYWKLKGNSRELLPDMNFKHVPIQIERYAGWKVAVEFRSVLTWADQDKLVDATMLTCGEELLALLKDIEQLITERPTPGINSSASSSNISLQLPAPKHSRFKNFLHRKSSSKSSASTSFLEVEDDIAPETLLPFKVQVLLLQAYCERFTRYYYAETLSKSKFDVQMKVINDKWWSNYTKARTPEAANNGDSNIEDEGADKDLFLKWLLEAVHGQSLLDSNLISQLSRDLDFPEYEDPDDIPSVAEDQGRGGNENTQQKQLPLPANLIRNFRNLPPDDQGKWLRRHPEFAQYQQVQQHIPSTQPPVSSQVQQQTPVEGQLLPQIVVSGAKRVSNPVVDESEAARRSQRVDSGVNRTQQEAVETGNAVNEADVRPQDKQPEETKQEEYSYERRLFETQVSLFY